MHLFPDDDISRVRTGLLIQQDTRRICGRPMFCKVAQGSPELLLTQGFAHLRTQLSLRIGIAYHSYTFTYRSCPQKEECTALYCLCMLPIQHWYHIRTYILCTRLLSPSVLHTHSLCVRICGKGQMLSCYYFYSLFCFCSKMNKEKSI